MKTFNAFLIIYGGATLILILADLFSTSVNINYTIIAIALAGMFLLLAIQDGINGRKKWAIFYIIIGALYLYTGLLP